MNANREIITIPDGAKIVYVGKTISNVRYTIRIVENALNLKQMGDAETPGEPGHGTPNPYRFDLLSPHAMAALAELRARAAKTYGNWTYRRAPAIHHVAKALAHIYAFLAGDTSEIGGKPSEHLKHALCRLMFAVDMYEMGIPGGTDDEALEAHILE